MTIGLRSICAIAAFVYAAGYWALLGFIYRVVAAHDALHTPLHLRRHIMPVPALIRDSFFGQLVYYASGRRYFRHEEEKPGFVVPERYTNTRRESNSGDGSENATLSERRATSSEKPQSDKEKTKNQDVTVTERVDAGVDVTGTDRQLEEDVERGEVLKDDPNLVDWYGPDDPEHPFNVCILQTLSP